MITMWQKQRRDCISGPSSGHQNKKNKNLTATATCQDSEVPQQRSLPQTPHSSPMITAGSPRGQWVKHHIGSILSLWLTKLVNTWRATRYISHFVGYDLVREVLFRVIGGQKKLIEAFYPCSQPSVPADGLAWRHDDDHVEALYIL